MNKIAFLLVALVVASSTLPACGQTLTILHSFTGGALDGEMPASRLAIDKAGNLYGTTEYGGSADGSVISGNGTVFRLDSSGNETVLHTFRDASDGANPFAGLLVDKKGNLYGTTVYGGAGYGVVFRIDSSGTETVLHRFTGTDGFSPFAPLVMDKDGALYGTTALGGSSDYGTVFKLDTSGRERVLHNFANVPDGALPFTGLVRDKAGNLYGTTSEGGSNSNVFVGGGIVFRLDAHDNETVLHRFTALGTDGENPQGGLVADNEGNLYGTTEGGGAFGWGSVFRLDSSGNMMVLYSFSNSGDGVFPAGDLLRDKDGNLYGTTFEGGSFGYGTVFKVDLAGTQTVLHSFADVPDGAFPDAGLIMDKNGNLYGTTLNGGPDNYGIVFKLQVVAN